MQIVTNAGLTAAYMDRVTADQLPYALSLGINNTMQRVRDDEIRRAYDRTFKRRSENFFKHTHATFRSNKSQAKSNNGIIHGAIQASHLRPPPGLSSKSREKIGKKGKPVTPGQIARHITGGTRAPTKAQSVAVASRYRRKPVSRSSSGAIRPGQRPKALIPKPTIFVTKGDNGVRFIMRRTASAIRGSANRKAKRASGQSVKKLRDETRKVETLFALLPNTKIKPTYNLMGAAIPALRKRLPLNIGASIGRALRTAKPVKAGMAGGRALISVN